MIADGNVTFTDQRNRSPWECPTCGAPEGGPCRHVATGFARDPKTGHYEWTLPGDEMQRMHPARPRIRCVGMNRRPR